MSRRVIRLGSALAIGAAGLLAFIWLNHESNPTLSPAQALLTLQNRELEGLVASAERGTLLDFSGVLIVVEEALIRDLLLAAIPLDADIGRGFRVRIETANAVFSGGVALVTLSGFASLQGGPDSSRVSVLSVIDGVTLDPKTGTLRCGVSILGVEAEDPKAFGADIPLGQLTEALTRGGLALLLGPIEIPVNVENNVAFPAVASKRLAIAAETVPLTVAVSKFRAFGHRLWIVVDAALPTPPPPTAVVKG